MRFVWIKNQRKAIFVMNIRVIKKSIYEKNSNIWFFHRAHQFVIRLMLSEYISHLTCLTQYEVHHVCGNIFVVNFVYRTAIYTFQNQ